MSAKDDLLQALRAVDARIRAPRVDIFFEGQPTEVKQRFISQRQEVRETIRRLESAKLASIRAKLQELEPDLQAGIDNLRRVVDRLNSAIAIIDDLSALLGFVARVLVAV